MKCQYCHKDIPDIGLFCPHCGKPKAAQTVRPVSPVPPLSSPSDNELNRDFRAKRWAEPTTELRKAPEGNRTPRSAQSGWGFFPVILALIVAAVLGVVILVFLRFGGGHGIGIGPFASNSSNASGNSDEGPGEGNGSLSDGGNDSIYNEEDDEENYKEYEEEFEEFKQATSQIREAISGLSDEDGYLEQSMTEEALANLSDTAEELKKQGIVKEYFPQEHSIGIRFESGVYYIFSLPYPGCDSSAGESLVDGSIDTVGWYTPEEQKDFSDEVNDFIIAIDPFASEAIRVDGGERGTIADNCRSYIRDTLDPAISDKILSNEGVTTGALESLQNAEIFLWHGHGGHDSQFGTHLCTGEKIDGVRSYVKLVKGSIAGKSAATGNREGDYLAVNGSFFTGDTDFTLTKGMAYCAACESGADDTLADAFREKGAETVFINRGDHPVDTNYDITMMQYIIICMSGGEDGIFHTAEEALSMADQELRDQMNQSNHFTWPQNASYTYENGQLVVNQGVYTDIVGEREYTLVSGVKGRLVDEITRQPLSSDTLSRISVRIGETDGHFQDDGTFYIDKMTPSTPSSLYTAEICLDGEVVNTVSDIEVQSHRYTDLGDVGVSVIEIDWRNAYESFVLNGEYLTSGGRFTDRSYIRQHQFSLYDMDGNRIPELFIYNGESMASSVYNVYTCIEEDGQERVIFTGTLGYRSGILVYAPDSAYTGIYFQAGNMGSYPGNYYTLENNQVVSEPVVHATLPDGTNDWNQLNNEQITGDDALFETFVGWFPNSEPESMGLRTVNEYKEADIRAMGWNEFLNRYGF